MKTSQETGNRENANNSQELSEFSHSHVSITIHGKEQSLTSSKNNTIKKQHHK